MPTEKKAEEIIQEICPEGRSTLVSAGIRQQEGQTGSPSLLIVEERSRKGLEADRQG